MGLWEDLKKAIGGTRNKVAAEAAKSAAKGAYNSAVQRVSGAGDSLLDGLQDDLDAAEDARVGRKDMRPDEALSDDIASQIHAMAKASEASADILRPEAPEQPLEADPALPPPRVPLTPEERAAAKLDALKRKMGKS